MKNTRERLSRQGSSTQGDIPAVGWRMISYSLGYVEVGRSILVLTCNDMINSNYCIFLKG